MSDQGPAPATGEPEICSDARPGTRCSPFGHDPRCRYGADARPATGEPRHGQPGVEETTRCRRCSVCEGMEHHWMPDCDEESGEPLMVCKHCPATTEYFDDEDDEDDDE